MGQKRLAVVDASSKEIPSAKGGSLPRRQAGASGGKKPGKSKAAGASRPERAKLFESERRGSQPQSRRRVEGHLLHLKGTGLPRRSGSAKTGGVKDMSAQVLEEEEARQAKLKRPSVSSETSAPSVSQKAIQRPTRERSRRYRLARSRLDRTKSYSLEEAVELLKKVSIARYDASVEAHLNLTATGIRENVTFPHSTGRKTRVAIATDSLLKDVKAGKIDFDVLVASPDMMPKIAKVAKILGPKGLMPNPKAGTVTPDPEKKKQALEGGQTLVKSEAKAPLMHVVVGKISAKEKELEENIQALLAAVTPQKILKLTLATSNSPGIRVDLHSLKPADKNETPSSP